MIAKVVKKLTLKEAAQQNDLEYWLSKTPEERIAAVEFLRWQYHGDSIRFQRLAKVVQRRKR